jgi:aryl-alcohol dehydrogenase-like predicted oxidoreductase
LTDEGRVVPSALGPPIAAARAVAARAGVGLTRLALGSALDDPRFAHVLVGFDRAAQLHEALAIARAPALSAEVRAEVASLDLRGDPAADPRTWPIGSASVSSP